MPTHRSENSLPGSQYLYLSLLVMNFETGMCFIIWFCAFLAFFFSLFRNQNECAGYWPWPFPSSSLWNYDKKSPSCFSYFSFSVCIASSPLFSSKGLTMPHWIAPDHSVLKSLTLSVTVSHILLACKNTYGHTATSFIISFSLYLCPHLWTFCMLHYHNSSLMH